MYKVCAFSRRWDICWNVKRKIIELSTGAAMLEDLLGPPIWRLVNSVNLWILFCLLYSTDFLKEPKNIYTSTFPNTLNLNKMAKNHEISVYFSTNAILAWCHAPHIWNLTCASFQTKDAIKMESCKQR